MFGNHIPKKRHMNLYDVISKKVSSFPEKIALRYFGLPVSYGRFGQLIDKTASAFSNLGIRPGDIVCLSLPSTPESIATIYALNKIGAIISTIDLRYTATQTSSIVNRLNAKMLFIMNFNVKEIAVEAKKMCVEHIVVLRGCEIFPPKISSWYAFGELFNGRRIAFNSNSKFMYWRDFLLAANGDAPKFTWPDDSAQMLFQTSGTTGRTKSVMVSAENITISVDTTYSILNNPEPSDTILCLIPIFAFYGFATSVHLPLSYGLTVDIVPIWKPKDFVKTIAKHKPQHVFSVPSSWDTIFNPANRKADLSTLKSVGVAGDVLKPEYERAINEFLVHCGCKCSLTKAYGMTETAGLIAYTPQLSKHKYELGYSGKIVGGHKVRIVNGEVCISHFTKLLGYYGNEEATKELIKTENNDYWLYTGDYGHFDSEGNLYVTGRMKRMLVRFDGTKIFPIEIEDALMRHPNVQNCAVIGIRDKKHEQSSIPIAFCVLKNKKPNAKDSIMRFAKDTLQDYLCPSQLYILDEIPTTDRGKVDYLQLMEKENLADRI
jgi:long-chain acyl-CoA synthetase